MMVFIGIIVVLGIMVSISEKRDNRKEFNKTKESLQKNIDKITEGLNTGRYSETERAAMVCGLEMFTDILDKHLERGVQK